ncbi:MAG: CDP-diacylglycerol--glycerol-3-phosphate 3-phosphatidyltransferase [Ignavibacteriales bacterium]
MVLPNQLTLLRIILTPVFYFLFISDEPFLEQISIVVFLIAAITDWYDGWLARKFNYITNWGKFLDPLADKILTSAAFIALVHINILPLWMVLIIIFRDFLITGMRAFFEYKKEYFSTSYLAKLKTFIQMTFLYYLLLVITLQTIDNLKENFNFLFEILLDKNLVYLLMLGITILTVFSGIQYFVRNKKSIEKIFARET